MYSMGHLWAFPRSSYLFIRFPSNAAYLLKCTGITDLVTLIMYVKSSIYCAFLGVKSWLRCEAFPTFLTFKGLLSGINFFHVEFGLRKQRRFSLGVYIHTVYLRCDFKCASSEGFPIVRTLTGSLSTLNLYMFMKRGRPSEAFLIFLTLTRFLSSANT